MLLTVGTVVVWSPPVTLPPVEICCCTTWTSCGLVVVAVHWPLPLAWGWPFGVLNWLLKVAFLLFFYIWMRWTLPRYRYDQLMSFGWKWLLPAAVVNVILVAAGVVYFS